MVWSFTPAWHKNVSQTRGGRRFFNSASLHTSESSAVRHASGSTDGVVRCLLAACQSEESLGFWNTCLPVVEGGKSQAVLYFSFPTSFLTVPEHTIKLPHISYKPPQHAASGAVCPSSVRGPTHICSCTSVSVPCCGSWAEVFNVMNLILQSRAFYLIAPCWPEPTALLLPSGTDHNHHLCLSKLCINSKCNHHFRQNILKVVGFINHLSCLVQFYEHFSDGIFMSPVKQLTYKNQWLHRTFSSF